MITGFIIAMSTAVVLFIIGWALSNVGIDNHKRGKEE